jgi:dTDP-4-amino-4,6-dideoxygalactose transaminase
MADVKMSRAGTVNVASVDSWQVPLAPPLIRDEQLVEVLETYRSGWLTMGEQTRRLESAFSDYSGAEHCLALSSCSAALHLACVSADLGRGDTVVLPSLTFAATANAAARTGATCVFADIAGLERPWITTETVEPAIDASTKAIMPVWYGGHPGDVPGLVALAAAAGAVIIEDAAHACGSWVGARHAGTFGLAGALSFSGSKNLGIGEGGMLLTSDAELAERVGRLRWHGVTASTWDRHRDVALSYQVAEPGFNYRIDDPRAALARARLRCLDEENRDRERLVTVYRRAFEESERIRPTAPFPAGDRWSHCLFVVVLGPDVDRDRFRAKLAERGVQTSVHFPPPHLSPAYASGAHLPTTEEFARRAVSLPVFPHMAEWQQELVIDACMEAAEEHGRGVAPQLRTEHA